MSRDVLLYRLEGGGVVIVDAPQEAHFSAGLLGASDPAEVETQITLRAKNGIYVYRVTGMEENRPDVLVARKLYEEVK